MLRAGVVSAVLVVLGAVLGLGRDLILARYFGASAATDAFLVAWLIPETAAPLLVEDAMAFLLVPAFSRALLGGKASVRDLMARTLPRISVLLVVAAAACAVLSPHLVAVLAPGMADPELAVRCMRLTSISVLMLGLAGYLSAALRSHGVYGPPAAIYAAGNVAVIGAVVLLHGRLGVVSAAWGIAAGGVLMVAVQVPSLLRRVGLPRRVGGLPQGVAPVGAVITLGAFVPIACYTLTRQAQVFVERFFGASLPPGTISHLNYAQKVAQLPVTLTLVVVLVTFPILARSLAGGRTEEARRRVEADLRLVGTLVLLATAYLVAFAPVIVQVLFQRGEFDAADTAATASVLRVYALGLLGQAMVGVLCRCFFSKESSWYPARLMALGLLATALVAAVGSPIWGAEALAAANAIGITLAAVLMLLGVRRRVFPVSAPAVGAMVGRLAVSAVAAGVAGWLVLQLTSGLPALLVLLLGGVTTTAAFLALAAVLDPDGSRQLRTLLTPGVRRAG